MCASLRIVDSGKNEEIEIGSALKIIQPR